MKRTSAKAPAWATGFPPVEPRRARVLILGTLPSAESIRQGQYYAHPRNVFWPIMGALFGAGRERTYAARLRKLAAHGVMLWDVLHAAQLPRHGAIARAARARAAEYRIIDIPAPCDGRGRTGPGPSAPAMAIGLIACLIAGSSDLHVLELGRDVT